MESEDSSSGDALPTVLDRLRTEGRPFRFSDLPKSLRELAESNSKDREAFGSAPEAELQRCFDLESVSEVVRRPRRNGWKTEGGEM